MKLRTGYIPEYYVYIKDKSDFLNIVLRTNVIDVKMELENVLNEIITETNDLVIKHINKPLLEEDVYTDGDKVYNRNELNDIKQLLEIIKDKPLFPIVDNMVLNKPLKYETVFHYIKSGLITNKLSVDYIIDRIIEDIFKITVIENNVDKEYITNDFGIRLSINKKSHKEWFSYTSDNIPGYELETLMEELNKSGEQYQIDKIYLEEEFMVNIIEYSYFIADKLNDEVGLKDKGILQAVILDISSKIEEKLSPVSDKLNIYKFSAEFKLSSSILTMYQYLPYSSLRAKVIKLISERKEYEDT